MRLSALTLMFALVLVSCVAVETDLTDPALGQGVKVEVLDNRFEPAELQVTAGETVTWTWQGSAPHNVVGDGFESEIQFGGEFIHSFGEPGDYEYRCTIHPGMQGSIRVTET